MACVDEGQCSRVGRTTTLSTIAMSSAPPTPSTSPPTRLVVALLQTPHKGLHLKVLELYPALLSLPDTLPDSILALSDHDAVIRNLQSKQSPVEELLRQADSLIATQKPRAEVYAAMAESLGSAWSGLSSVLEARRSVLSLTLAAHEEIDKVTRRMDSTHQRCSKLIHDEDELPPVDWLKAERAGILKGVASALEACDALLGRIASFTYSIDSRDLVLLQDANAANRQVQRWLERLHDRRVLLEERLRVKREEVEERFRAYRAESDITALEVELEEVALGLESTTLGESLKGVEEQEEPSLLKLSATLKVIQEKTLTLTRNLDTESPKYTVGGSELRKRAFDLLARTADLLAEANDLELSLTTAATFFRLVEEGQDEEAIHLGDDLIHTHPPHRTQGIRAVHATLTAKKEEEMRDLDSQNAFLTSLNETFELLLTLEERSLSLPVDREELYSFTESLKADLTHRSVEIEGRLRSLEDALSTHAKLREEEELRTRTGELQTLLQRWRRSLETRLSVGTLWNQFLQDLASGGGRVEGWLDKVTRMKAALQGQNALDVREALAYLDNVETRMSSAKEVTSTATRHLQEEELEGVWPVLEGGESHLLIPTPPALTHIADHVLPLKSDTVRASVFGALKSSVRTQVDAALGRSQREKLLQEEEEYNTLVSEKESRYVEVVEEIRRFLKSLGDVCTSLEEEERRAKARSPLSAHEELSALERLQGRVEEAWGLRLHPQLESLVRLIFRVERVEAARREEQALRGLSEVMRREWIDERLGSAREGLETRLRAELVAADLAVIGQQLDELIAELEKPPSYGDSLRDAQTVVQNFERFERTVEVLETKLKEMLRKAGDVGEDEDSLKDKLKTLQKLRGGRKESLLLSLDYFSLIQEWEEEWERLESTLSSIRTESKTTDVSGPRLESLLDQVTNLRKDEARQEDRLTRINAMAARLFPSEETQHRKGPPDNKNTQLSTRLREVEEELRAILRALQDKNTNALLQETEEESSSVVVTSTCHVRFREAPKEERVSGEWEELRRSTATPTTLEKETQSEGVEDRGVSPLPPRKVEREVVTQTPLPGEIGVTAETQTEDQQRPSGSPGPPPPAIVEPLLDVTVEEGGRAVLTCRTSGDVGQLLWLKDGMDVSSNADFKTTFDDVTGIASLTIDEAVPEDAAVFTCRALGGSLETSGRLTVKEAEGTTGEVFSPPAWMSGPASVEVTEGEGPLIVEGVVDGYPLPTVTWEKDGMCIDLSHDYVLTFNNGRAMLLIEDPLSDLDSGTFTAIAVNRLGEARLTFPLRVRKAKPRHGEGVQAPLILHPLPKRLLLHTGQRADRLLLRFEYSATPDPTVTWTLNDSLKIEPNNAGNKMESGGGVASLTYESVVPSMSGKYVATVRNPYGSASTECHVTIKGVRPMDTSDSEIGLSDLETVKPIVKMPLIDMEAEMGKPARFDCVIVGVPEPEVIWYLDKFPVKESANHHLTFIGDRCSLVLTSVAPEDVGEYLVYAFNAVGEASSSARLTLKEVPGVIHEVEEPLKFKKLLEEAEMVSAPPAITVRRPSFPKAAQKAPRFATELQGRMVNEGETDVTLQGRLEAVGGADTEVVWRKGPLVLTEGPKYSLQCAKVSSDVGLTIRGGVEVGDAGMYSVTASNPTGTASSSAQLLVKKTNFPPVFNKRLEGIVSVEEGKRLFLEVDVFAVPPPTVTWTMAGGKEIREGVVVSSDTPTRFSFAIPEVDAVRDSGEVTVTARNSAGEAKSSCVIQVAPGPELERKEMKEEVKESVTTRMEESMLTEERSILKEVITVTRVSSVSPGVERGPSPEILVASSPSPTWTKSSENAVLRKVKTFEERTVVEAPPAGGVRTLPTPPPPPAPPTRPVEKPIPPPKPKVSPAPPPVQPVSTEAILPPPVLEFVPPPPPPVKEFVLPPPIQEFSIPPPVKEFVPPPPTVKEFPIPPPVREKPVPPPKPRSPQERPKSETFFYPLGGIPQEPRPRSELLASQTFRPSKFVPEKMRESSYSTDTSPILPLWTPSIQPPPPATTTSAFARTVPTQSFVLTPTPQQPPPIQPPPPPQKPVHLQQRPTQQPLQKSPVPLQQQPAGVKGIASAWPPPSPDSAEASPRNLAAPPTHQQRLLSPLSVQTGPPQRSRSPTPNLEALEMERSWSRPIRFASPRPSSPLRSPQVTSVSTPSPTKPIPPPKPTKSPSIYYVSVTSPPRTTPIPPSAMSPPPLSPLPHTSFTSFESSSYFEEHSSFTSTTTTTQGDPPLVPGETPQFLYAAPPPPPPQEGPKVLRK